jgi:hypothetical protein
MDLTKTITALRLEQERVEQTIATLQAIASSPAPVRRRGRKSMGAEERQAVSEWLKRGRTSLTSPQNFLRPFYPPRTCAGGSMHCRRAGTAAPVARRSRPRRINSTSSGANGKGP